MIETNGTISIKRGGLTFVEVKRKRGEPKRLHGPATALLIYLLEHESASYEQAYALLWPNADDEPKDARGVLRRRMAEVRDAIRHTPYRIATIYGEGFIMREWKRP